MKKLLNSWKVWQISFKLWLYHPDICHKHWVKRWPSGVCTECRQEAWALAEQTKQLTNPTSDPEFLEALQILKEHYNK